MEKAWESIEFTCESLSTNKYFVGIMMISLAIGGRFIIDELDDDIRKVLSEKVVRRVFIFCSFFMATRDILKAALLTVVFVIVINEFLGKQDVVKKEETDEKGSSFNKGELEKAIQKLKSVQMNM
jgi:hypothetical protein